MINFIVVEDNVLHQKKTEDLILSYMMKNKYEFKISIFSKDCSDLRKLVKSNEYNNIYILDFELPNTTAIDISRLIRKVDWNSPIIVFSAHGGMAYETFKQRLQILDFVNKQFEAKKNMYELFDICIDQLKLSKSLKFKIKGVVYTIAFSKIIYIYRDTYERKIIVVTSTKKYEIVDSLGNIMKKLDDRFLMSHKACIINMKRVESICWSSNIVTFDNGMTTTLISKSHKKELESYE